MIKFLLDENAEDKLRKGLLRRQTDLVVWRIGEPFAPALSTIDPDLLSWCQENDFSLVTNNRVSMPRHLKDHLAAGKHVPGIFILNENMELSETIEMLLLISGAGKPDEYADESIICRFGFDFQSPKKLHPHHSPLRKRHQPNIRVPIE